MLKAINQKYNILDSLLILILNFLMVITVCRSLILEHNLINKESYVILYVWLIIIGFLLITYQNKIIALTKIYKDNFFLFIQLLISLVGILIIQYDNGSISGLSTITTIFYIYTYSLFAITTLIFVKKYNHDEYTNEVTTLPNIAIFSFIFLIFITTKLWVIFSYNGSYSDEYYHITSAIEFIKTGSFAEIYSGSTYSREGYFTILLGLFFSFFGENIVTAKFFPAILGSLNFYILYIISTKILRGRLIQSLLMLAYSTYYWVIFNHFYIRFYVFLESLILIITYLFLRFRESKNIYNLYMILCINLFFLIFIRGASSNLISAYSLSLILSYVIINQKDEIRKILGNTYKYTKTYFWAVIPMVVIISYPIIQSIQNLLIGTVKYGNTSTNYYNFFLNDNFFIIFSLICSFLLTVKYEKKQDIPLYVAVFFMLSLHLISSPNTHVIRSIFYIIPLLLLLSFRFLDFIFFAKTSKKQRLLLFAIYLTLMISTIYNSYPEDFKKYPFIDGEIMYHDNSIYPIIKENCNDSLVITAQRPDILKFYNIYSNYYLNTKYSDKEWVSTDPEATYSFYNKDDTKYYYTYTKTPVITNLDDFKEIFYNTNKKICVVAGFMPYDWVNAETRGFVQENFTIKYTGISSTPTNSLKLFISN